MRGVGFFVVVSLGLCGCGGSRYTPSHDAYQSYQASASLPAPQQPMTNQQLTSLTEPQMKEWLGCIFDNAGRYMDSNEGAEVVARAAMTSCYDKEAKMREAVALFNGTQSTTVDQMRLRRNIAFDHTVQIIISQRVNLKQARELSKAWADCLADKMTEHALGRQASSDAVHSIFLSCQNSEQTMTRQLATFNEFANEIVENRKKRVLPIIADYVEKIRAATSPARQPPKPDLKV